MLCELCLWVSRLPTCSSLEAEGDIFAVKGRQYWNIELGACVGFIYAICRTLLALESRMQTYIFYQDLMSPLNRSTATFAGLYRCVQSINTLPLFPIQWWEHVLKQDLPRHGALRVKTKIRHRRPSGGAKTYYWRNSVHLPISRLLKLPAHLLCRKARNGLITALYGGAKNSVWVKKESAIGRWAWCFTCSISKRKSFFFFF